MFYQPSSGLHQSWNGTRRARRERALGRFRDIYKELVETLSVGDCTLAAMRMAARLKSAGYPDEDMRVFVPEEHPKEDPSAKAILMLAHVDVVEAKGEDWTRDPFTLIEEDGYFYGRGTSDMKAQAAIWVDKSDPLPRGGLQAQAHY